MPIQQEVEYIPNIMLRAEYGAYPFFLLELRLVFRTRKKRENFAMFNKQPRKGSRKESFFLFFVTIGKVERMILDF